MFGQSQCTVSAGQSEHTVLVGRRHRGPTIMYSIWKIMCFLNIKACQHQIHKIMILKKSDIQPSMVTRTQNLCSIVFYHLPIQVHTHSSEHTPGVVGSHLCCGAGEQLGVRCLAQGHLVVVLKVEESAVHFLSFNPSSERDNLSTKFTTWFVALSCRSINQIDCSFFFFFFLAHWFHH